MPDRTTVVLPPRLKQRATARARQQGISFAELVRRAIQNEVTQPLRRARKGKKDPLFDDVPVYDGPVPADFSINHDKYLYDEP
jgi:hypothetical protein